MRETVLDKKKYQKSKGTRTLWRHKIRYKSEAVYRGDKLVQVSTSENKARIQMVTNEGKLVNWRRSENQSVQFGVIVE